jgi:hypothetical protein
MSRKRKPPRKTGADRRRQARAERHLLTTGVVGRVNAVRVALSTEGFPGNLFLALEAAGARDFTDLEQVRVVILDVLRVAPFFCDLTGVTLKLSWDPKDKQLGIRAVLTMETAHEALAVADHSRRLLTADPPELH